MTRTGIAILAVCFMFLGWLSLALLLLLYGNDWWLSGVITLTVFAWLAGLLVVMFQQGPVRTTATGAVITSAVYWLLALGPWFSTNVGPTLLTSRALAHADLLLHGGVPQTQGLTWAAPTPGYAVGGPGNPVFYGGSGYVTGQLAIAPQLTTIVTVPSPPTGSVFQLLGHWLFIWFVAAFGGGSALLMQGRRPEKKVSPAASADASTGESPFAAAPPAAPAEVTSVPPGVVS